MNVKSIFVLLVIVCLSRSAGAQNHQGSNQLSLNGNWEIIFDDKNTVSIDFDKVEFPLILRKWQKGDFFFPIGMQGKKNYQENNPVL